MKPQTPNHRAVRAVAAGFLMIAALATSPAAAVGETPLFLIETITVVTERLSPEIVRAEMLLDEGSEVGEPELFEAMHRINRLPFVLRAEFSLRRGSARGRYELFVEVTETRRWFFQLGAQWAERDVYRTFESEFGRGEDRFRTGGQDLEALVGRRFAVGARGLLFASLGSRDGLFAVGYQRHDLFGRGALLSFTLAGEADDAGGSRVTSRRARVQLGLPIRGDHAVRLLASWDELAFGGVDGGSEARERAAEAAWVFNSLDDPVLPRSGLIAQAGAGWSGREDRLVLSDIEGRRFDLTRSTDRREAFAGLRRHWPLWERQSLSAGVRGLAAEGTDDLSVVEAEFDVGHQIFLLRDTSPERWRELRYETGLSVLRQEISGSPGLAGSIDVDVWRLRAGLVYRNRWGLFRLLFDYADRGLE